MARYRASVAFLGQSFMQRQGLEPGDVELENTWFYIGLSGQAFAE